MDAAEFIVNGIVDIAKAVYKAGEGLVTGDLDSDGRWNILNTVMKHRETSPHGPGRIELLASGRPRLYIQWTLKIEEYSLKHVEVSIGVALDLKLEF